MSVRIHAIAKETNKTSKEVIEILVGRGYDVKSASSSIDNITAESLIEELNAQEIVELEEESLGQSDQGIEGDSQTVKDVPFVKSKQDLDRERDEKEKAERAEQKVEGDKLAPTSKSPLRSEGEVVSKPLTAGAAPSLPPPPVKIATAPPPPHTLRINSTNCSISSL